MGGGPGFLPGASVALNFTSGQYRFGPGSAASSSFAGLPGLTVTRGSPATTYAETVAGVLVPFSANQARITNKGLLIEEARTNLFLNSFAPVTQNVTITATSYTITVWGTGSVTVAAGTATISNGGAASAGSPRTIGCTVGGTISITVTGSPTAVQVEAGTFGTSPIPTVGSSVARVADVVTFSGLSLPAAGTWLAEFLRPTANVAAFARVIDSGLGVAPILLDGLTKVDAYNGARALASNVFAAAAGALVKAGYAWTAGSSLVTAQGLTPTSDANSIGTMAGLKLGGSGASTDYLNSYIQKVVLYPRNYNSAELIAATT